MRSKSLVYAITVVTILGVLPSMFSAEAASSKGWGTAQLIETDSSGDAYYPQVSVDRSGNAIAVWCQWDGVRDNIWSNRYVVGTGWGAAQLIETNDSGDASGPQVSVDSSGNAIAVWQQKDGARVSIWSNRYVVGTGWGTAELIETNDSGDAGGPQVSADGSGNAIAVWRLGVDRYDNYGNRFTTNRCDIWSNRYVVGTGWGTAQLIETNDIGFAQQPDVAVDGLGNAIAVWHQSSPQNSDIWSNRYLVGTGWGTAELIETNDSEDASNPQVSADSSGNATVVWAQHDGNHYRIWSNRFVVGVGWGNAERIETNDLGEDATGPQVSVDSSGNAIVVWYKDRDTTSMVNEDIWSNRYAVGLGWGTAELIETDDSGRACYPRVSTDVAGNAIAVWCQYDGSRFNILANRYAIGTGWGTAELIETSYSGAYYPQVSMDISGDAIAVWHQEAGDNNDIWSNRYILQDHAPSQASGIDPVVLFALVIVVVATVAAVAFLLIRRKREPDQTGKEAEEPPTAPPAP